MVFFLLFVCCALVLVVFHRTFLQGIQPAKSMMLGLAAVAVLSGNWTNAFAAANTPTATTLAVTSSGGAVTSVTAGSVVTLTAGVNAGSLAVTTGQVNFCDASTNNCTDIHLLGTAQLTSAGTALLRFRPGMGNHSYRAVFAGTNAYASSSSSVSTLVVTGATGTLASATTIAETGGWGNYALTATVTESGGTASPSGAVSFLDTSNGNSILDTVALGPSVAGVDWPNPQTLLTETTSRAVAFGDFNGDGIPDLAAIAGAAQPLAIFLGNANGTYTTAPPLSFFAYTFGPMVVADFDCDGKQDLAVLNGDSNTVTILLGNGDGTFHVTASSPAIQSNSHNIAVGDFNGDGIPDLAVTSISSNSLNIFLGNGDGTFTATPNSPVASGSPTAIAAGDFNRDGKLDLAVTDLYTDTVSILLGNGDGTFSAATSLHSGSSGSPLAVADFNGDGKLDLAVGVTGAGGASDSVTILVGNGDGTFTSPASGQAVSSIAISSIQVGDFNGDGTPDLALTDSAAGTFSVLLANGSGSFTSFSASLPWSPAYELESAAGDFNGDGRSDLLIGNEDGGVSVYLTAPTETATATANVSVAGVGQHLVDAGYSGDSNYQPSSSGTLPLWGVLPATATTLTVSSGGAPVTSVSPGSVVALSATVTVGGAPATTGQVNFCDASSSQCTDIHLLGSVALSSSGTATFQFVPGAGVHSYKALFVQDGYGLSSSSAPSTLTVGPAKKPVYSDTTALLVAGGPGNYSLTATVVGYGGTAAPTGNISFLDTSFGNAALGSVPLGPASAGLGWLVSQTPALASIPISEVTGDFNGDGIPDLALLWTSSTFNSTATVTIFFGNGDGAVTAGPTTQTQIELDDNIGYMIAGDFNGDGKTDLAVLSYPAGFASDYVTTLLGNGNGTFAVSATSLVYTPPPMGGDIIAGSMTAADFNGDGKMDLAVVGDYPTVGGLTIVLGNGDGTFTATGPNLAPTQGFGLVASGDFNGDGIPDLVATHYFAPGGGTVFLGKGDGTFTSAGPLDLDTFPSSIVAGDVNGDSKLDLAFGYESGVAVFLGNGDGTFHQATGSPISTAGVSLTAGDFNHDGKLDLAGVDNYFDLINVFLGAGDGTFTPISTTPVVSQEVAGRFPLVAADFNSDGVPDLAMLTQNAFTASLLLAEPTETASATMNSVAPVGAGTHSVVAGYPGDANYGSTVSAPVSLAAGLTPLVLSPAAGTYSSVETVTLSESVPGATIFYSLSGPESTSGFVPYTAPIPLNRGGVETIQAYATETGYQGSPSVTATYHLNLPAAPAPVFSPAPGSYPGPQTVTIADSVDGATIYYTTNGSLPTTASPQYSGPISVSTSETLVAIAAADGYTMSAPASAQYIIGSSAASFIYTLAGNGFAGYAGDGGPATLANLNGPGSSVVDSAGNLYIADGGNNVIRKVAAGTGVITTIAGTGASGYSGDYGAATSARLSTPTGLSFDGAGNLYFSDAINNAVRMIAVTTGVITTVAGNGTPGYGGDGSAAVLAQLNYPGATAVDSAGNLYIADSSNSRIREVAAKTGIITTFAGNGQYGYAGDGGPASAAELEFPRGVVVDASGSVYFADTNNHVIRKVTAGTGVISTVAGVQAANGGAGSYSGDGGPASSAGLNRPGAVTLDSAGNLYIADSNNNAIRKVTASSGIIQTIAGNGYAYPCNGFAGDGGAAAGATLCSPSGISIDSAGNLYIADNGFSRIRIVTTAALPPTSATAAPVITVPAGTYAAPQTVTITDATPGASIYLTTDGASPGTSASSYNGPINVSGGVTIQAVAVAPGHLTSAPVSATYAITSPPATVIKTIAGNGVSGFTGVGGPATSAEIGEVGAMATDSGGNVFFTDTQNNVVWKVTAATGNLSIVAGNGAAGFSGDGGPATEAQLNIPNGLAVDSIGNLFIADLSNSVVRRGGCEHRIDRNLCRKAPPIGVSGAKRRWRSCYTSVFRWSPGLVA